MPRTLERTLRRPEPVSAPTRVRLTRRQCETLVESGELKGRFELVDGEIVSKMGQKPGHAGAIRIILLWLASIFGPEYIQSQLPIDVSDVDNPINEPEPDLVVLTFDGRAFTARHPAPADLAMIIEVADTSLAFDLSTKSTIYARAGIADYWVVDIVGRKLYVHRVPSMNGYIEVTVYSEDEFAAPVTKPDVTVRVGELLPPVDA